MKISIDTNEDSPEDIRKAMNLISDILAKKGYSSYSSESNFSYGILSQKAHSI